MQRRRFRSGVAALGLMLCGLDIGQARAQTAASSAYQTAGEWLFELYAGQSVRLSVANALRQRPPGTEQVLTATLPVMVKALERHRAAFVAAMIGPLQSHFDASSIGPLLAAAKTSPPILDEEQRRRLFEVDADFRRDQQAVIGAMTLDIGLMIAATLSEKKSDAP
jgi:hypothetical protein